MRFRALSLLDITKTGVSRNKLVDDQKRVAQFANYMTVENCLQLRSNIKILTVPKGKKMDISNYKFGDNFIWRNKSFEILLLRFSVSYCLQQTLFRPKTRLLKLLFWGSRNFEWV